MEGLVLFVVLWTFSRKSRPLGMVTGLFIAAYAVARIIAEFFRVPDAHIGYVAFGWLTQGQILSVPMFLLGIALMLWGYRLTANKS